MGCFEGNWGDNSVILWFIILFLLLFYCGCGYGFGFGCGDGIRAASTIAEK